MKKYAFTVLILLAVIAGFAFTGASAESGAVRDQDTSIPEDTPVTYGYLEKFREQLKKEIIEELLGSGVDIGGGYEEITLHKGEFLIPGAGCEIIYRGGGAAAVTSSRHPGDGVTDASTEKELFSGEALEYGHIYFASQSSAEKAIAALGENVRFTVNGNYEIR